MPNARRPAGPTKPTHLEREDATEREQIDEALGDAQASEGTHAGKPSRHNPTSPQVGNEDRPRDEGRDDRARS